MKTAARYLIVLLAVSFITHLAVGIGNWPDGYFDIVPIFIVTLGIFVGYLALKLFWLDCLSSDESEKKKSSGLLIIKVLFSVGTLYLLLRYGALAILANGMMSFGSYSPMTAAQFFLMTIPVCVSICYGVSVWKPFPIMLWPLRMLAIFIAGVFLFKTFGHPGASDAAVFINLYFSTWAFLTVKTKDKKIHQDDGINSESLRSSP